MFGEEVNNLLTRRREKLINIIFQAKNMTRHDNLNDILGYEAMSPSKN